MAVRASASQLLKLAMLAVGGVVALGLISLASSNPLAAFFRYLSWAGTGMLLFSVFMMILTFRRARAVEPPALLVSLVTCLLSTFVSLGFSHSLPSWRAALIAFAAGGLLGAAWSLTTLLFVDGSSLRMRGTAWYLGVWALTLALNQILATASGHAPVVATALTLIGVGVAVGNTLGLITRAKQAEALIKTAGSEGHV
jgi:hypothetical protein